MDTKVKNEIEQLCRTLTHSSHIRPEEMPDIDLYMDQVTTFMDAHLAHAKRRPDDKILTKTMINNYAKNHVLPAPVKKKYSKSHLLLLTFIYYLKSVLSIGDIQTLLAPLAAQTFDRDAADESGLSLAEIYGRILNLEEAQADQTEAALADALVKSEDCFADAPKETRGYLQLFAFICTVGYDVYTKQRLIEKLIDNLAAQDAEKDAAKEKGKKPESAD